MSRPVLIAAAVAVLAFYVGTQCNRPPGQPSVDSTRLANAADTIRVLDTVLLRAAERLDTVIRWREARRPPIVPPRGAEDELDSLRVRVAYDSATIAVLDQTLREARDTIAAVRQRLAPIPATVDHGAVVVGRLERRAAQKSALGVTYGTEGPGVFVSRDLRLLVPLTGVVQVEEGGVRVGVGLRF